MAPSLSHSSFVGSAEIRRAVKQSASREGTHRSASRFQTVARKHATHLYCDGSCRQQGGASGIGVVMDYRKGKIVRHASKRLTGKNYGPAVADYEAVLYGLRFCQSFAPKNSVLIMTDQQSVVDHLTNKTGTSDAGIASLKQKIANVAGTFPRVAARWIDRTNNEPANKLARDASGGNCVEYDFDQKKSRLVKNEA